MAAADEVFVRKNGDFAEEHLISHRGDSFSLRRSLLCNNKSSSGCGNNKPEELQLRKTDRHRGEICLPLEGKVPHGRTAAADEVFVRKNGDFAEEHLISHCGDSFSLRRSLL